MESDSLLDAAKRLLREKIDRVICDAWGRREVVRWNRSGRPIPPPNRIKAETLKEYGRRFHLRTLIETGTHVGEMIYATRASFDRVISIEIDADFYEQARKRFRYKSRVQLIFGDSGEILGPLVAGLEEPCLFWLDAHHDEDDTPIDRELSAVVEHARRYQDVIVIDIIRATPSR
jgi:hypothetical protein